MDEWLDGWMDGWKDGRMGKLMIPRFEHIVCNEFAMQGIGAHKNGPLAALWLEMLVLLH